MPGTLLALLLSLTLLFGMGALSFDYFKNSTSTIPFSEYSSTTERVLPAVMPRIATTTVPALSSAKKTSLAPRATTTSIHKEVPAEASVVTPGPLTRTVDTLGELSVSGVHRFTNEARAANGALPALALNETLNRDAELKLQDMFAQQYFDHISPIGVGPSALAKQVGYQYIVIGENLALGNFGTDAKLVDAWMNSPGHRANILNAQYQEIGIAVGRGTYKGSEVWMAVQSFGKPLSACPTIDSGIAVSVKENNTELERLNKELDQRKVVIDGLAPRDPNLNLYIQEYDAAIAVFNKLVEETDALIKTYNTQVDLFNACVHAGA